MLPEYKTKTNIGILIGWILTFAGNRAVDTNYNLGIILAVAGLILFVWGCMQYALGKGHSKWWGLLGIFNLLGLLILFFLSDRYKNYKK